MFGPLLFTGVGALVAGAYAMGRQYNDPNLKPTIGGMSQNGVLIGVGLLASFFLPGALAAASVGVAIGGALAEVARTAVKTDLDKEAMRRQLEAAQPAPAPAPPQGGGGLFDGLSRFFAHPVTQ